VVSLLTVGTLAVVFAIETAPGVAMATVVSFTALHNQHQTFINMHISSSLAIHSEQFYWSINCFLSTV
jgi:hypothetical protein